MTIVYHAIDGMGLGHLMRLSAILKAAAARAPELRQVVVTSSSYSAHHRRLDVPVVTLPPDSSTATSALDRRWTTLPPRMARTLLERALSALAPTCVVYDTHFSATTIAHLRAKRVRNFLVLRKCRPERLWSLVEQGILLSFDEIWIPHEREEFEAGLSPVLSESFRPSPHVHYLGPIVFPAAIEAAEVERVSRRNGIDEDRALVLVTFGGGGFTRLAPELYVNLPRALRTLASEVPSLRACWIGGPYAGDGEQRAAKSAGLQWIAEEADLQALMARAELVVGHAGYNTVQEILRTGARAILAPMARKHEDQAERADRLAARGRALVLDPRASVEQWSAALAEALRRPRPAREALLGAERAAARLLARTDAYRVRRLSLGGGGIELTLERLRAECLRHRRVVLSAGWSDLEVLAPAVAEATVPEIELDLGRGTSEDLARRAEAALDRLAVIPTSLPPKVTLTYHDDEGLPSLPELAGRLAARPLLALVARQDRADTDRAANARLKALELCRGLELPFPVDVTNPEHPRLTVDGTRGVQSAD
jgi:UDP-N-acetylglucosamine--N-acetylmuramyl-(pentapeptide) pyrophosphoryl-undecaprenol N-acetylglucosamine transferase